MAINRTKRFEAFYANELKGLKSQEKDQKDELVIEVIDKKIKQLEEDKAAFQEGIRKAAFQDDKKNKKVSLFDKYREYYYLLGKEADANPDDKTFYKNSYAKRRAVDELLKCYKCDNGRYDQILDKLETQWNIQVKIIDTKRKNGYKSKGISRKEIIAATHDFFAFEHKHIALIEKRKQTQKLLFNNLILLINNEILGLVKESSTLENNQLIALNNLKKRFLLNIFSFDPEIFNKTLNTGKITLNTGKINAKTCSMEIKNLLSIIPTSKKSFFGNTSIYQKLTACITKIYPELARDYSISFPKPALAL